MSRIFVDMDGVTAKFEPASIEEMTTPGFFISRKPVDSVIEMVKILRDKLDAEVYVLSAYLLPFCMEEKREWNAIYTQIPVENQIYVPYGVDKAEALEVVGGVRSDDILVDDFTQNLNTWPGVAVKLYNGINGTHGTWKGYSIHSNMTPEIMATQLMAIQAAKVLKYKIANESMVEDNFEMTNQHRNRRR